MAMSEEIEGRPASAGASHTEAALYFLEQWRPNGPWVLTAILPDSSAETRSFEGGQREHARRWIDRWQGTRNLYFTVNDTKHLVAKKPNKGDIGNFRALHVDVDPRYGHNLAEERDRILKTLRSYSPPPSVIIDSGGGYQAFWILREPVPVVDLSQVEGRNKFIAGQLGADSCHNIDRLMRLPGTINIPTKRKREKGRTERLSQVVEAHWDRTYTLEVFPCTPSAKGTAKLQTQVAARALEGLDHLPSSVPADVKKLILDGGGSPRFRSRSEAVWAVLCALSRAGCSDEQMLAVLTDRRFQIGDHIRDQKDPVAYAQRQVERVRAELEDPDLHELNQRHAVVIVGGRTVVLTDGQGGRVEFLSRRAFEDFYANRAVPVLGTKGNVVQKPLGRYWFEHPGRRQYDRVEFLPGEATPGDTYNLWRGWEIEAKPGRCDRFLSFVLEVIAAGDQQVYEYLMNWMALKVQKPSVKLQTSIALRGGQGVGKSVFAELYGSLFGPHFVKVTDRRSLMGNFNAHLAQALLIFADEMAAPSNADMAGRLKTLVTQPHLRVEPKGLDSFEVRNCFALIMASNNEHVVTADADDRRWVVLDVTPCRQNDHAYFRDLLAEWDGGGREALFAMLLQRDLRNFEHRNRPRTAAHTDQVEHSFTGARRILHEMLRTGETPFSRRSICTIEAIVGDGGRVFINASDLVNWARERGIFDREVGSIEKSLGHLLKKLAGVTVSERRKVYNRQVRGVWLPPLAEARRRWCEITGRSFEWEDGGNGSWDVTVAKKDDEPM